ncbi:hypothetical protein FSP39_021942 [Pinctada imbricata]|uniref:PH domain-containing protein n=1 Tax=Pinctada imbricata TaxID=66713 RepID=A0AA88YI51_PINIB|nr:hypothetical protein FSP39_021942 [Pinctada imbricata]
MHELFAKVLNQKDLSKAGELFTLDDGDIAEDLSEVLTKIGEIVDTKDYAVIDNDQSVVEICVTRVTTAIRETETIEKHAPALVHLLELCQNHNLNPSSHDRDPPHAKVASDVMSCLFTHYGKTKVMKQAIPIVVNFLSCDNKELSRNVSSYLSLAALDNADLLARHMELIITSILRGNYILSTVLPQIYSQNRQPIIDNVVKLVEILDVCESSERVSLIQVMGMIARNNPKVLEEHISKFCTYLSSATMTAVVMVMFVDMATASPAPFVDHVTKLHQVAEQHPAHIVQVLQVIGAIGSIDETQARSSMKYFMSSLSLADQTALTVALQEIKALCLSHHALLAENIEEISKLAQSGSSAVRILVQQLKEDHKKYSTSEKEMKSVSSQTEGTVTIITVGNPPNASYSGSNVATVQQRNLPPSNMSSDQSLTKSSRTSTSNLRVPSDRPVSPASTFMSDRMSLTSAVTVGSQTVSTLPPEPIRDGVQHFCDKHMTTIRNFISHISARIPLPDKCSIIKGKHRRYIRLNFLCGAQGEQCLYSKIFFTFNTKVPKTWIHLMFLAIQAQAPAALSQQDSSISSLKHCWDSLLTESRGNGGFLALVTSSFPSAKDQDALIHELHYARFFDVFEFNAAKKYWACFMCNHPEKMWNFLQNGTPVIAGQLKEKKGRWKFLKRWKTRYFTLSGAQITYNKSDSRKETLPVSKIQSVKAVRKGIRDIPKAFEIFTEDQTYTFKAKDHCNIEQWVQCLHVALAQQHKGGTLPLLPPPAPSSRGGNSTVKKTESTPMKREAVKRTENVVIERPRSVMDTKL